MDKLRIAYIQTDLIWEESAKNIQKLDKVLDTIEKVDIIVLPEMFNTGFTMNVTNVAQTTNGAAANWLRKKSSEKACAIMGSAIIKENSDFYNRLMMASPGSAMEYYDKRHLFRMGSEHERFKPGLHRPIFNYLGWRIRPLICYDLRFPVWSRNENNYDILVYVANWPGARREVWKTLLKARAIENQCYVIGVNRVGKDGMDINYTGDSMVINPRGEITSQIPENEEAVNYAEISLNDLNQFRAKFPVHLDADHFELFDL